MQALGWGVHLEITLPHQVHQPQEHREKVVLKDSNDLLLFKESEWMGKWRGYYFTSIDHEGKHLTGYKLDQATEPIDTWSGPRPHKYFGLQDGILGYHYDARGPAPCHDPTSDSLLLEMGWGQQKVQSVPAVEPTPKEPEQPEALPGAAVSSPEALPSAAVSSVQQEGAASPTAAVPPVQPVHLSAESLAKLNAKTLNNVGALDKVGDAGKNATTRRAAYNALLRLKNNADRLKEVDPKLRQKLLASDKNVPSDLIADLMKCGGDLNALNATFTSSNETSTWDQEFSKLKPLTELQIIQMYGEAESKNVMAHKVASGLTQEDPNNPGKLICLMMSEERPNQPTALIAQIDLVCFSCEEDWGNHKE